MTARSPLDAKATTDPMTDDRNDERPQAENPGAGAPAPDGHDSAAPPQEPPNRPRQADNSARRGNANARASASGGQPPLARPLAPPMESRRYSSRHHGSHRHSSSRRKLRAYKLAIGALVGLLVASIVLSVMLFFRMQLFRGDALRLDSELQRAEDELTKTRQQITEMNNDLRILLANRIPGISELVFDRQIELNERYVKNITFVQSGVGEEASIEFSAVLQNARSGPIMPQVDVVLFDESGLQTGIIRLDQSQTVSPVEQPELKPGESRTYSAQIPLNRRASSKYFVVDVN